MTWSFTWSSNASLLAFLGGLLVGAVAVTRMFCLGKITGISGIFGELVKFSFEFSEDRGYRFTFIFSLILGGFLSTIFFPDCFENWDGVPLYRLILGGILVGVGTALGNGCTSGHGVCGISSFRIRSLIATCTFMFSGVLTAVFTNTSSLLPTFQNTLPLSFSAIFAICCLLVCAVFVIAARHFVLNRGFLSSKSQLSFLAEFITGLIFAFGMAISNMTKLSATIAFLNITDFNPALAFVMMGAIGLTAPFFYLIYKIDDPLLM